MDVVFVTMTDFARIENGVDRKGRVGGERGFVKCKGFGSGVLVEFRGIGVRF